jgi:hypothetical protein
MTSDEKNAILQFMGVTYGHSHKLDKGIVGESQFVKPISNVVRRTFEEVLKTENTTSIPQQNHLEPIQPVITHPEVGYISEQPTPQISQYSIQPEHTSNSNIFEQLKTINLHLMRIGDILEEATKHNNDRPKKKIKDIIQK